MKKVLASLLFLISALIALTSCAGGGDTPAGMQLVFGGESEGYYFYAPEEWTVSNVGEAKAAYISTVNTTTVAFSEIKLAEGRGADYFFGSYFSDNLSDFTIKPNVTVNGEAANFGNPEAAATKAKKYVFDYKYDGVLFRFMQILVQYKDSFYIFQYSAIAEAPEGVTSNYDKYLEKAQSVIDNFKFTAKVPTEGGEDAPEKVFDSDGFLLISDAGKSGFDFFAAKGFSADISDAMVSASHADGSNVNLTKATGTGVSAETYWERRKEELSVFVTDFVEIKVAEPTKLGNNSGWAFLYEYSFRYNGEAYKVTQILAVHGPQLFAEGYIFTYTAKAENYDAHTADVQKMIDKVVFK